MFAEVAPRDSELLLAEAAKRPPADRGAFLEAACRDDHGLLQQVSSLLQFIDDASTDDEAIDDGAGFLASPVPRLQVPDLVGLLEDTTEQQHEAEPFGDYRLLRLLGHGGLGMVFEARRETEPVVALKLPQPGPVTIETQQSFAAEGKWLGELVHPGIVHLVESGSIEGSPYLAMELVRGEPLDLWASRADLSFSDRCAALSSVCAAVDYVHRRGLLHLDLKPDNILVDEHDQPKLIDFGIVRPIAKEPLDSARRGVAGSPTYMSPEQLAGDPRLLDERSDVYALGVVLSQVLGDPKTVDPPSDLATVVRQATAQEPDQRLRSAAELCRVLRSFAY